MSECHCITHKVYGSLLIFNHLFPVQEERALVCRIHQELNCSLTPKYAENTVRAQ